jgi:hypothetical protein
MKAAANLQQHPLSAAFPAMQDAERQALRDSITEQGVLNAITLYEGMVLDGWHRYCIAAELGMPCPANELDATGFDDGYPRDFVLAQNKARRHITSAQLALATTAVYLWYPRGRVKEMGTECPFRSTAELAEAAGVSERSIKQAKVVQNNAAPEIVAAVKAGDIGLPKAAAIARLPKDQQAAALQNPMPKVIKQVVVADEFEDGGPDADELAAQAAAEQADRETLQILLDADDQLAAAVAEIKRLKAELDLIRRSRDAAMNRAAELAKWVKKRDWQISQLSRGAA